MKVRRYLDFIWDSKKQLKIEESELLDMLNDDLKSKITVYLNARILRIIKVFSNFEIDFLSEITFIIQKETYANDEDILVEGDQGGQLFFIVKGKVALIHKRSHTFIQNLQKDSYFGEIGFFTDLPRQTTIKVREFTELFAMSSDSFLELTHYFPKAQEVFEFYCLTCRCMTRSRSACKKRATLACSRCSVTCVTRRTTSASTALSLIEYMATCNVARRKLSLRT